MAKQKERAPPGGFAGIPRIVMESSDYMHLSFKAKALLVELAYQYKGNNNGDLTAAPAVLKARGWKRAATISTTVTELVDARLVIKTREGKFLNPGGRCALYAVTWQPVNECPGKNLDVPATITPPRKFSMERND
ncbi:MAG: hypothetical protein VR73_02760 [Gammaproteobacteria bacterium BRH_c0]|nr:MAG: hypothetical protein VR73_02760 [Gammaproteobacteria bacterium BRH_c0]